MWSRSCRSSSRNGPSQAGGLGCRYTTSIAPTGLRQREIVERRRQGVSMNPGAACVRPKNSMRAAASSGYCQARGMTRTTLSNTACGASVRDKRRGDVVDALQFLGPLPEGPGTSSFCRRRVHLSSSAAKGSACCAMRARILCRKASRSNGLVEEPRFRDQLSATKPRGVALTRHVQDLEIRVGPGQDIHEAVAAHPGQHHVSD